MVPQSRRTKLSPRGPMVYTSLLFAACSLTTNVDDVLCPESDPNCADAEPGAMGGDGDAGDGDGDDNTGGAVATGGMQAVGGCEGSCGGAPPDCPEPGSIDLEFHNDVAETSTDRIRPHFRLFNKGDEEVAFRDLSIRYYFTEDEGAVADYSCTFAFGLNPADGCGTMVSGSLSPLSAEGTNTVLTLTFPDNPTVLLANTRSSEIKGQVQLFASALFDQSNDYSFTADEAFTADDVYGLWENVTLYCGETLLFGTEPE